VMHGLYVAIICYVLHVRDMVHSRALSSNGMGYAKETSHRSYEWYWIGLDLIWFTW
ncbi:hypothetical protein Tco_1296871, partial [Tanacetum coccineum]